VSISTRGHTITAEVKLETEECCNCGVIFAIPADLRAILQRKREQRNFYCPNGHAQHYLGEREEDRLRRELQHAQDATARAEADVRRWRDREQQEERAHRATKGVLTKTRKRVANGVCPCCHRSFINVQRHMETKHPGFAS
jgi:hypothetical protein